MSRSKGRSFDLAIGNQTCKNCQIKAIKSPFNGKEIGEAAFGGPEEIEKGVVATVEGFPKISRMPAHERSRILQKISEIMTKNSDELAEIIRDEAGKPIRLAKAEVERAITTFATAADEALRIDGELIPFDINPRGTGRLGLIRRFPVGPVLGITPFNFPLMLVSHKVAPAIASGNSIMLKPASQTPMSALSLAKITLEAGLPAGVFNVIPCSGAHAEPLAADERFKKLTFTGSPVVGWKLKSQASRKKVTLELGGNAAAVVEPDANLDDAASKLSVGSFAYAGQTCISVQRIFVQESIYDQFVELFLKAVRKEVPYGDPADPAVICGPIIDSDNIRRIEDWVSEAKTKGAQIQMGGERKDTVISPTVLTNVDPKAKIFCQEVFGPTVAISTYKTFDEALKKVNDSKFGLQAGIFSKDIEKVFQAFRELEVGGIIHNDGPSFRVDQMPYGGVKESGFGREGLRYAIHDMTEPRLLIVKE